MKTKTTTTPTTTTNQGPMFCGLAPTPVTKKQLTLLQQHVGKMVWLKADRVLGVGREQVQLVSVDLTTNTAQVLVPDWGTETAYLYMFVRLY